MNKNNIIYLIIGIVIGGFSIFFIDNIKNSNPSVNTIAEEHNEHEEHSEIINIPESVIKEFGIEIRKAESGRVEEHIELTGEIVTNPDNVAHIVPRFAGIVKSVYKKIGDKIKKGERIATIESNESLVSYDVTSSINGTILELHMTPGELIGDEKHVVMIANLKDVWAELNIYQQNLNDIKIGQRVDIESPHSKAVFRGKIFYISPIVDEMTRTAVARVKLKNKNGIWKPGMFISGSVLTKNIMVKIAVPINAVQILNGNKVIFVNTGKGYRPQAVTLGRENSRYVEIVDGIHQGDLYVAKGAYTFKSEILKESFGGHEH